MLHRALALGLLTMAFASCSSETSGDGIATAPTSSPSEQAEGASALFFLRGATMFELDLATGESERLGSFPSQDVFAAGDGFVVVEERGAGGEFAAEPFLTIRDASGSVLEELGSGFAPLVGRNGRIAYLRPVEERVCEGETCEGSLELMVAEPGEDPRRLLGPGAWNPLAWSERGLVVADALRTDEVLLVDDAGRTDRLPFAPNQTWDATGDLAIVVDPPRTVSLTTGEEVRLPIDGVLADGVAVGEMVYAVELRGRSSRLVSVSLDDGAVLAVPGSKGAMGPVLATSGSGEFAYVRADGLKSEAVVCEDEATCAPVLRWAEGVTPLALR